MFTGRWLHMVILSPYLVALIAPAHGVAAAVSGTVTSVDGRGVANAVVFVQAPVLSPLRTKSSQVVDQIHKTFVPGLLPIVVGTSVRFPNHDQIHHHVYSFSATKTFELPLYKGEEAPEVVFDKVGVVKIACNIHDWMAGIILVLPSSHFAVTDVQGRFMLENLPAGEYTLVAWHELSKAKPDGTAQSVKVGSETTNVMFSLPLGPERPRPAMHGTRGEP